MKNSTKHLLLVIGLALGAWLIYEIFSFLSAVKNKAANVEGDIAGFFGFLLSAPGRAAAAVAGLFSFGDGTGTPTPTIKGGMTDAQTGSALLGIPAIGTPGSALDADGNFHLFSNQ